MNVLNMDTGIRCILYQCKCTVACPELRTGERERETRKERAVRTGDGTEEAEALGVGRLEVEVVLAERLGHRQRDGDRPMELAAARLDGHDRREREARRLRAPCMRTHTLAAYTKYCTYCTCVLYIRSNRTTALQINLFFNYLSDSFCYEFEYITTHHSHQL